jgi:hypothetical protein
VLELQFHASQIQLPAHGHRDAAQIGREVGLKAEAGAGDGWAQGGVVGDRDLSLA